MSAIKSTDQGQGFPVIFIHGFCETKEMWYPFVEPLTHDYRIVCIDLPGFGESELPSNDISLESVADDLATYIKELSIDKAVFIGHSLGGYVALALAERYPNLVYGLGLFHSTAFADTQENKHKRNKAILFLQQHPVAKFIEPFIPTLYYLKRKHELSEEIQRSTEIGLQTNAETVIAYSVAMRERPDRFQVWADLPGHCLFIGGANDDRVPVLVCEEHIVARNEVDGYIMPETAHMGMFERPSETLKMVKDYLLKAV